MEDILKELERYRRLAKLGNVTAKSYVRDVEKLLEIIKIKEKQGE